MASRTVNQEIRGQTKWSDDPQVGLRQHRRDHRPAIGGSAGPIYECGADVCAEWVKEFPDELGRRAKQLTDGSLSNE